jgi:hypothetical protein
LHVCQILEEKNLIVKKEAAALDGIVKSYLKIFSGFVVSPVAFGKSFAM